MYFIFYLFFLRHFFFFIIFFLLQRQRILQQARYEFTLHYTLRCTHVVHCSTLYIVYVVYFTLYSSDGAPARYCTGQSRNIIPTYNPFVDSQYPPTTHLSTLNLHYQNICRLSIRASKLRKEDKRCTMTCIQITMTCIQITMTCIQITLHRKNDAVRAFKLF